MSKLLIGILLCLFLIGCSDGVSDRAKEFFLNAYTGKPMQAEEWLTKDARSAQLFNAFGGLEALIRDCAAETERNQGLKSVNVLKIKHEGKVFLVEVEIVFNNNQKVNGEDAWIQENGKWKITDKPIEESSSVK